MRVFLSACRADSPLFDLERNRALLTPERAEMLFSRPVADQRRSVAALWLLSCQLENRNISCPQPLAFCYGAEGKPALASCPNIQFNLSHSGNWAVCALCTAPVPVGVDIQRVKRISPRLQRHFSTAEQELLRDCPPLEQDRMMIQFWCLKEAYCKCTGRGLRVPLNRASFTLCPVSIDRPGFAAALPDFPDEDYQLALCAQTEEPLEVKLQLEALTRESRLG